MSGWIVREGRRLGVPTPHHAAIYALLKPHRAGTPMAEAMDTLIGGPEAFYSKTPHHLATPIGALVAAAVRTGAFRDDIGPNDLLRALVGVANVRPSRNWKQSAVRMVDLLLNGMQVKT